MSLAIINPYKLYLDPILSTATLSYEINDTPPNIQFKEARQTITKAVPRQKVSCGLFGIQDDYIEKFQSLDARFIKNKAATFFFEASNDSMQPLIFAGDILIVDRSIDATHGKVAVLSLYGDLICKRISKIGDNITLISENNNYADINVTEEMELTVFGVVSGIAREII